MRSYKPVVMTVATLSILPFVLATYFSLANTSLFGKAGVTLFATYGAVVLSLLSGIIWGRIIELPESKHGRKLLVSCNVILLSLLGFFAHEYAGAVCCLAFAWFCQHLLG
ncbi:hypothetical protein AB8616_13030 [Marinomonas sp. RS-M-Aa-14]|uniref:hypothetical protein n=1 Tax=Marinomonas sp. RS-M-Aa-14 TaxID=3241169 RepID=UPI003AAB46FC